MYHVTDTHALLWYFTDDSALSKRASDVFNLADKGEITIVVPAIVLVECIDILDKKKVEYQFDEILFKMAYAENFELSEINWSIILEVNRQKGFKDIHDRLIVATASIFGAPIITRDRVIRELYHRTIW